MPSPLTTLMLTRLAAPALLAVTLLSAPAGAQEIVVATSKLVRALLPTVVNITAYVPGAADGSGAAQAGAAVQMATQRRDLGSGFVIDSDGTIVTNYHVVEGASAIVITFADGNQANATIKEADRLADIALLHVRTDKKLEPVRWAAPGSLHVGDPVLAIGNPLGVGMSVTAGIVSALNRNIMETPYDNYIQTDAPINHGNSGGPLFDLKGEVVGINTAIISPTEGSAGLGFAMPAPDARFVIGQLEKYGWIRPGWIGVKVQQVTPELANALALSSTRGAIVAAVPASTPAEQAGLRPGDIIEEFRGRSPADERALLRAIAMAAPGTDAPLRVLRDGKTLTLTVNVGEFPRRKWQTEDRPVSTDLTKPNVPPDLGIRIAPLPEAVRVQLAVPAATPAVLVAAVQPGTDAAWRGLAAGEAIERVQDQPVDSAASFEAAVAQARQASRAFIAVLVATPKPVNPGPEWMALRVRP